MKWKQIWLYRSMRRMLWTEHASNEQVLKKIETKMTIIHKIRKRHLKSTSHNEERKLGKVNTRRVY